MAAPPRFLPTVLLEPPQVHGTPTPEAYAQKQRQHIAELALAYPTARHWRRPWAAPTLPPVFVSGGKWVVECGCGNCPSVWLTHRLARCFECGAVYTGLAVPSAGDRAAIQAALVARPRMVLRYWTPEMSIDALTAWNDRELQEEDRGVSA